MIFLTSTGGLLDEPPGASSRPSTSKGGLRRPAGPATLAERGMRLKLPGDQAPARRAAGDLVGLDVAGSPGEGALHAHGLWHARPPRRADPPRHDTLDGIDRGRLRDLLEAMLRAEARRALLRQEAFYRITCPTPTGRRRSSRSTRAGGPAHSVPRQVRGDLGGAGRGDRRLALDADEEREPEAVLARRNGIRGCRGPLSRARP